MGRIYCSQPPGGIPLETGHCVDPDSLILLSTAVYGLVNAPMAWRRALVTALQEVGYRKSEMDPFVMIRMAASGLSGLVAIEVDDLLNYGDKDHEERMAQLRRKFRFGRWVSIYQGQGDFAGRTLVQQKGLPDQGAPGEVRH